MGNLFGMGLSGLGAAQSALNTTSNNIANVNTPGYTRRTTLFEQALVSQGQGTGVRAAGIQRHYQRFLSEQLNNAESRAGALTTHLSQLTQVNNLLGDSDANIATFMQEFFAGLQTLAGHPADPAARQSLLGDARGMAGRFRAFADYLHRMHDSVATQLHGAVDQINNYGRQIAHLNEQITLTQARTGRPPNQLLDQRNRLVSELGQLVDVDVTVQDGDSYIVMVGGRPLVDATGAHGFAMSQGGSDPSQRVIAYRTASGALQTLDPDDFEGGTVGGLIAFRDESLQPAQLRLDQLAHVLAAEVNTQHAAGFDLNGAAGAAFFAIGPTQTYFSTTNTGTAQLTVSFVPGSAGAVVASNYRVDYVSGQYAITRLADGKIWPPAPSLPQTVDGIKIELSTGAPASGDSFLLKPLSHAAAELKVLVDDPAKIAAAQTPTSGAGDNRNARALADLQNMELVGGTASFNDSYAQLISDIGNKTRSLQVNSAAQDSLTSELRTAEQSVSGVNLAEERINLLYYTKLYRANAKVIQTASTLFDTLLRIA